MAARIVKASFLHLLILVGLEPKPSKTKGPSLDMVLLGLLLDSTTMEIRVPPERIADPRGILATWMGATTATKRQLQSLVDALSLACFGVRWGRGFLRRLIAFFHLVTVSALASGVGCGYARVYRLVDQIRSQQCVHGREPHCGSRSGHARDPRGLLLHRFVGALLRRRLG